jgi:hypothetical protein
MGQQVGLLGDLERSCSRVLKEEVDGRDEGVKPQQTVDNRRRDDEALPIEFGRLCREDSGARSVP